MGATDVAGEKRLLNVTLGVGVALGAFLCLLGIVRFADSGASLFGAAAMIFGLTSMFYATARRALEKLGAW